MLINYAKKKVPKICYMKKNMKKAIQIYDE